MKIRVTEADLREAYTRRHLRGWAALKAEAQSIAAQRLLEENGAETRRLIELVKEKTGAEWYSIQDRITELFSEHDVLIDIAYPRGAEAQP